MKIRDLIGQKLERATFYQDPDFPAGEACKIVLDFASASLVILPLEDTDEIELKLFEEGVQPEPGGDEILNELVGTKLAAYWYCENHQGYFDQVLFGFHLMRPNFGVLSEASALHLVDCGMASERTEAAAT